VEQEGRHDAVYTVMAAFAAHGCLGDVQTDGLRTVQDICRIIASVALPVGNESFNLCSDEDLSPFTRVEKGRVLAVGTSGRRILATQSGWLCLGPQASMIGIGTGNQGPLFCIVNEEQPARVRRLSHPGWIDELH
jgi:hypothetical protein